MEDLVAAASPPVLQSTRLDRLNIPNNAVVSDFLTSNGDRVIFYSLLASEVVQGSRLVPRLLIVTDTALYRVPKAASGTGVFFDCRFELLCFSQVLVLESPQEDAPPLIQFNGVLNNAGEQVLLTLQIDDPLNIKNFLHMLCHLLPGLPIVRKKSLGTRRISYDLSYIDTWVTKTATPVTALDGAASPLGGRPPRTKLDEMDLMQSVYGGKSGGSGKHVELKSPPYASTIHDKPLPTTRAGAVCDRIRKLRHGDATGAAPRITFQMSSPLTAMKVADRMSRAKRAAVAATPASGASSVARSLLADVHGTSGSGGLGMVAGVGGGSVVSAETISRRGSDVTDARSDDESPAPQEHAIHPAFLAPPEEQLFSPEQWVWDDAGAHRGGAAYSEQAPLMDRISPSRRHSPRPSASPLYRARPEHVGGGRGASPSPHTETQPTPTPHLLQLLGELSPRGPPGGVDAHGITQEYLPHHFYCVPPHSPTGGLVGRGAGGGGSAGRRQRASGADSGADGGGAGSTMSASGFAQSGFWKQLEDRRDAEEFLRKHMQRSDAALRLRAENERVRRERVRARQPLPKRSRP